MFKVFITLSVLIFAVYGAPLGEKEVEESRAELTAAGLSPQVIDGLIQIWNKIASEKPGSQDNGFNGFIRLAIEFDAFMKTQSPADQAAFEAFNAKKKAAWDALFNGQH